LRQSNVIFGTLIFAFIVFITMRGQLPAYLDLFKSKPPEEKKSEKSSIFDGFKNSFDDFVSSLKGEATSAAKKAAVAYVTGGAG